MNNVLTVPGKPLMALRTSSYFYYYPFSYNTFQLYYRYRTPVLYLCVESFSCLPVVSNRDQTVFLSKYRKMAEVVQKKNYVLNSGEQRTRFDKDSYIIPVSVLNSCST